MRIKVIIACLIIGLICSVSIYVTYAKGYRLDPTSYTFININTINSTDTFVLNLIETGYKQSYEIPVSICYHATTGTSGLTFDSTYMITDKTISEEDVSKCLDKFLSNRQRHNTILAKMSVDCVYTPTVDSNLVNEDHLLDTIMTNWQSEDTYDITDFYCGYNDVNSTKYQDIADKLNSLYVSYTTGDTVYAKELKPVYHKDTNSITFDKDILKDLITPITLKYDTVGTYSTVINSVDQGTITVSGGTWGDLSDTNAEIDHVFDLFTRMQSEQNRKPIFKQEMPSEIPSNFIEVDKSTQHVYVHEGDEIKMDSPCVTGRPNGHSTPTGIFYISECMKNKTLRGPGYASFVNRWMRLTGEGVGLHDATWRSNFGGSIYKSNGSHGCINLPKQFAYDLYDYVSGKTKYCVIIHD